MADTLSAYLKCRYEINNGNKEFSIAIQDITKKLEDFQAPEIAYFMDVFVSSYDLTLDDLLSKEH
ncbi:MAG: hypothetical protein KZQ64_08120 [gamma proteobacterium symbiont of Bathyaustriella thionipta]|nr:hypothetical protein [gamma proteobacterium symbiont of Bathyaustriella thionipta]MCU7950575.1 hypothetical protein [gamma proteobacterium symbiont of Bathyaustriella thionipta]MCU7953338.1 hypothetical protein [gamma proteobacterium symbiont of Bathyaustriella thionipta]MCU7957076.1 hypothetical protein [gamma proteobacterium symbiont of Bathyaustriella thionipta]